MCSKGWLGRVRRYDSQLRTVLEGRKGSERSRTVFLDWLLKNDEGNVDYGQLKTSTQDRISWCQ